MLFHTNLCVLDSKASLITLGKIVLLGRLPSFRPIPSQFFNAYCALDSHSSMILIKTLVR